MLEVKKYNMRRSDIKPMFLRRNKFKKRWKQCDYIFNMDIIDQTTDENALPDIVFYNRIVNGPWTMVI